MTYSTSAVKIMNSNTRGLFFNSKLTLTLTVQVTYGNISTSFAETYLTAVRLASSQSSLGCLWFL